jgi:hypothetical protein
MEALKKKVLSLLYSEVTCLIVTQAKDGILVQGGDYDALASRARATGGRRGVDVKKGATRGEVERFSQQFVALSRRSARPGGRESPKVEPIDYTRRSGVARLFGTDFLEGRGVVSGGGGDNRLRLYGVHASDGGVAKRV